TEFNNGNYDDASFWAKVSNFAKVAGREVIEKALWLYYAAQRPETPPWAKVAIYGALGYFIMPIDAIPDLAPVVGYSDDLTVLGGALVTCAACINDEVKVRARAKLRDWFGD
ncbi:MAG: hypothetical protein RJA44_419, partial [Pseudomonadota bacterium]